ncbi:GPI ethanolamine phosphate transferase 3 [Linum perenne]
MDARWISWCPWGILLLHGLAILIFTKGFLLTRTELPYYSSCSDVSESPCFSNPGSYSDSSSGSHSRNLNEDQHCWSKPAVDRVVIIILDALRFDFLAPSEFFPEKKPWMDKLPVLQNLAFTQSSSAKIFKAIADPPTTSLQRLKGLTTGGLPTFIDVGNSFGAPAIVEDNLIHQLVSNGKRVMMMGDDTWVQLFPDHFNRSYPYPSFNVKDLDTVDNGCITHIFESLYQEDWDVLIAHFLGVDHAGHIFGVNSVQMVEKLEQYNKVLEEVIEVLSNKSGPGGLHENTLLLVMGDHGQTLNGDHGGGSAEEVETSFFAMGFKLPPSSVPHEFDSSSCLLDSDKKRCVSSIQQLDFAATVSALIGVPFPFGSIGSVNAELYALAAGTWNWKDTDSTNYRHQSKTEEWMKNYVNTLCINSWQVKRYIDVYSASSIIGFSSEDLVHISNKYAQLEENWSRAIKKLFSLQIESIPSFLPQITKQISAYLDFLSNVSELARSKWTEFNMKMMGVGLGTMLLSLFMISLAIRSITTDSGISFESVFALAIVIIRACSFLSNSYILEEGKVACFLLATTGIAKLRYSLIRKEMLVEAIIFLLLVLGLRFSIEVGMSKQAATSAFMHASSSWISGIALGDSLWVYASEVGPTLAIVCLSGIVYKAVIKNSQGVSTFILMLAIPSYILVAIHWALESNIQILTMLFEGIGRNYIPQTVYAIGASQLLFLAFGMLFTEDRAIDVENRLVTKTVHMLSAWSPTIILLSGKQGSWIALAAIVGGYCITRLASLGKNADLAMTGISNFNPLAVTQWNLLAVCLFFATGHWCAFDGLRYGAAFVGFDEFILVRQAILLTLETFGFSLILPVLGLPLLLLGRHRSNHGKNNLFSQLSQTYLAYGLITATTVTATILCVTIQRRHLMVWGLFAPKFVFDVVGLLLTEAMICLTCLFYSR